MWYVFTEDKKGRLGFVGSKFSEAAAVDLESKYELDGKTHKIEANNEAEAKQRLRGKLVRERKDLDLGYRNVHSKSTVGGGV